MGRGGRDPVERRPHQHPLSHPLAEAVRRALPDPLPPRAPQYLALLERRFAALDETARGGSPPRDALGLSRPERALARAFLRPLEGTWHDGDENRLRGHLDRWNRTGDSRQAARALLEAAGALVASAARAETLWFYLWEMESMLESVAAHESPRRGGR